MLAVLPWRSLIEIYKALGIQTPITRVLFIKMFGLLKPTFDIVIFALRLLHLFYVLPLFIFDGLVLMHPLVAMHHLRLATRRFVICAAILSISLLSLILDAKLSSLTIEPLQKSITFQTILKPHLDTGLTETGTCDGVHLGRCFHNMRLILKHTLYEFGISGLCWQILEFKTD